MKVRADLRRSTPLRLTALLILIFSFSSLATFGAAYLVVRDNFDALLTDQIQKTLAAYQGIDDASNFVERLRSEAALLDPGVLVFEYVSDTGVRISNVADLPPVDGFTILSETVIDDGADQDLRDSYLASNGRVAGGELTIALSREQIIEMGEIFLTVFLVSLLPTMAVATLVGIVIANQARGKIEAIQDVLQDITSGTLRSKVQILAGEDDDLSSIGHAVNRMARSLDASIDALRQVSTDIAHDLKTPIQRVAVLLERLSTTSVLSPEQESLIQKAKAQVHQINQTFQSLLQIAQLEGRNLRDRFKEIDLGAVARNLVEIYAPAAEDTGHHLKLTGEDPGSMVSGDKTLLAQVIANLLENALRHTPQGSRISVSVTQTGTGVSLSVSDDGPGIPVAERDNVFRRLYRLERSRTSDGSGLGLSLVAAIAELHDATLTLGDASPGLIVTLVFPAMRPDE